MLFTYLHNILICVLIYLFDYLLHCIYLYTLSLYAPRSVCSFPTNGLSSPGNDETVRQVSAAGGECWAYTVDLCDRHSIYKVAARVKEEVGKVSKGRVSGRGEE